MGIDGDMKRARSRKRTGKLWHLAAGLCLGLDLSVELYIGASTMHWDEFECEWDYELCAQRIAAKLK